MGAKDVLIARLEAELVVKDQTILDLHQDRLRTHAAQIELSLRKLLKPSKEAIFNWQTKTFEEPPPNGEKD